MSVTFTFYGQEQVYGKAGSSARMLLFPFQQAAPHPGAQQTRDRRLSSLLQSIGYLQESRYHSHLPYHTYLCRKQEQKKHRYPHFQTIDNRSAHHGYLVLILFNQRVSLHQTRFHIKCSFYEGSLLPTSLSAFESVAEIASYLPSPGMRSIKVLIFLALLMRMETLPS